jgi:TolB protein
MATFNETVAEDLLDSGLLEVVPKTSLPLQAPQTPSEFQPPASTSSGNGMWLADWAKAPTNTNYVGIGNVDVNGTNLVLQGSLLKTGFNDIKNATLFSQPFFRPATQDGARQLAHDYAAKILQNFGYTSLAGSKIYFVSERGAKRADGTSIKEIWSMDFDGQNQQRMTNNGTITKSPAISADGKHLAYIFQEDHTWKIRLMNLQTRRAEPFVGPSSSALNTPDITGGKLWFSMVSDGYQQLMTSNLDGSNRQRISHTKSIEVSPRVNPKNPDDVVFISGRTGHPQLYRMKADGSNVQMITDGSGEVANPAWSPDGTKLLFAWTRGYDWGNFNIFVINADKPRDYIQLTRGTAPNENPYWAPDGVHIVFSRKVGTNAQIFTMLANGTRVKQLTNTGHNEQPVWAPATKD